MEALLIIDMQNDFMPWGTLPVPKADTLVQYINELIEKFPYVIASQDWHPPHHISFASTHNREPFSMIQMNGMQQILWPDHCIMDTKGASFVRGLHIDQVDTIIQKGCDREIDSYSAFFDNAKKRDSGLHDLCQKKGISSLTIIGVALEYCVQFSVLDALDLGYSVSVDLHGCKGVEVQKGDCEKAIKEMKHRGAIILD